METITDANENNIMGDKQMRQKGCFEEEKRKVINNSTPRSDIISQDMSVRRNGVDAEGEKKAEQTPKTSSQNQKPDHCMHPAQSASKDLRPISVAKHPF